MFKKKEFFEKIFKQYKKNRKIPLIDMHVHTSWVDGKNTVLEMSSSAVEKRISTILFSEHTRANSGDWFSDFTKEILSARNKFEKALEVYPDLSAAYFFIAETFSKESEQSFQKTENIDCSEILQKK